ncbi:MAG: ABC transporter permease [bacterium]
MTKFLHLAWRNIWRNKRRTLITISAIAFAILMVALTRSLQYGTYDTMESLAVRLYHGDIQIHRSGFQKEQSLTFFLDQDETAWQTILESGSHFTTFSRRVTSYGLVSSDSSSAGALIVGVEPQRENSITRFSGLVRAGRRLQPGDDHRVLLGQTLAKNLQVVVGDTVVVLTQGYRNQMGADVYTVQGLISAGHAELDRGIMIMPLHNAQELFSLDDGITQVVFGTTDFRKAADISKKLVNDMTGREFEVMSWEELMPELKQIIVIDNVSGVIYLAFILIVVGIEIFNATMMSIIERSREFGILQSMGMKPNQISVMIFIESFFKVSLALIVGLVISVVVVSVLTQFAIPLPEDLSEAYASYGFVIEDIRFSGRVQVYLEPLLSIALIAVLALIYPMYRTSRLSPVEAFRKT